MEDWREKFDTKLAILMGNRAEAEVIAADVAEVLHHFGQEYSPEQVRKMTTEELIGLKDECLGTHVLEAMRRNRAKVVFHYEKQNLVMDAGDIFYNFNGSSYRLMEKYDDRTMLFMQESNGMFVVAQGVDGYVRYPKNTGPTEGNVEYGIEWGRGTYLGSVPSCIDFARLRREYGKEPPANEKGEYEIEVREVLSRTEKIKAECLGDAIDEMMERYEKGEIVLDAEDFDGQPEFRAAEKSR